MSKPRKEKFTPGPWTVFDKLGVLAVVKPDATKEIVHWGGFDASSFPKDNWANARLIAAAPDLYVAVGSLLKAFNQLIPGIGNISCSDYANINIAPILAEKALAKARGESR